MYYNDPEANKYGTADYGPFDNTMAFSDVSIRAGKYYFQRFAERNNILSSILLCLNLTGVCFFLLIAGFIRKVSSFLSIEFQNSCFDHERLLQDVQVCVHLF